MRIGLWLLEFRILLKILKKINGAKFLIPIDPTNLVSVGKIVWAVNVASRYMPFGVKCLARALTAQALMNRYGYSSELRIGVAKGEGGKLEAHAWIEYQGRVAIGNLIDLSRFTPLPSLEGVKL
ncbi:hypothetical protein NUACC21_82060 [Scytonema sp. NUACC21]